MYEYIKETYSDESFFTSQFSYCPFIWMYCNRTNNEKINRLYERCLRIIYQDKQSFEEREEDHSLTIHQRNLQYFLTEIQKKRNSISCLYKRILYAK